MISGLLVALFAVLCSCSAVHADTIYFLYQSAAGVYPAVCSSGTLSGTLYTGSNNVTGYNITSASGSHIYYPSSTSPSISTSLGSSLPATCDGYTASNTLPITSSGLNLQYGSTCLNLYNSSTGVVKASPDAVSGIVNVTYSTSPLSVSCPAAVAATASGSACVGFTYTLGNAGSSRVCGAGVLNCQSYGANEYACSSLVQGTQFYYNATTSSYTSFALTGEVECNSFGDGYLPLNYEGISFSGSFNTSRNCISIYSAYNASASSYHPVVNYDLIAASFPATFTYGAAGFANSAEASCSQFIPALSTVTPNNYSCTPGTQQNAASNVAISSVALILSLLVLLVLA